MKTFHQYLNESNNLSKTEQDLLNKSPIGGAIPVQGKREHDAALKLVKKGLTKRYNDMSGVSKGEYGINPFTRKQRISKSMMIYAGELFL